MFRCPQYLLDSIRKLMVSDGNLELLSEYIIVGLGGGYDVFPKVLDGVEDVSGFARTIKTYTGYFNGVKVSTIAVAGGQTDAEWVTALAHLKQARALIGVGWCGGLQEYVGIGDAVISVAAMRDEDASAHYVDPRFPAVADFELAAKAAAKLRHRLQKLGANLWVGVTVSTSAMLAETPERVELWARSRALCIDLETSVIYALSYLAGVPALVLLAVSDNVLLKKDCGFGTELSKRVDATYRELISSALETLAELHSTQDKV